MRSFDKIFKYRNYQFNINVKLHDTVERHPGGKDQHLIVINDMGVTNFYKKYQCDNDILKLQETIELAMDAATEYVNLRETITRSSEELLLLKMGFKQNGNDSSTLQERKI